VQPVCTGSRPFFVTVSGSHHDAGDPSPTEGLGQRSPSTGALAAGHAALTAYRALPLRFDENRGQADRRVQFLAHGGDGESLFLTATDAVLTLPLPPARSGIAAQQQRLAKVQMRLSGTQRYGVGRGEGALPGRSNYFLGRDPTRWRTDVPAYSQVRYRDVYPGVDLLYYGDHNRLEYDFVVAPGADPKAIRFSFDGVEQLRIDNDGPRFANGGRRASPRQAPHVPGSRR
jgi:hypothetical protein